MNSLANVVLMNALLASALAVFAFTVGRITRRPALAHALWVLVLLKLVTPPLIDVPVLMPEGLSTSVARVKKLESGSGQIDSNSIASHHLSGGKRPIEQASSVPVVGSGGSVSTPWVHRALNAIRNSAVFLMMMAVTVGTCGAILWYLLQLRRAIEFRRFLRSASVPRALLQWKSLQLARRMGIRRPPKTLLVEGTVSPMLWGVGRWTRILLPKRLLDQMDSESQATLIAHELAHFRRGDHWIRLLELLVTGIFWWHPVVWWARRELEIAEEQCCDAWVVEQFPSRCRRYAEAILDAVDFLSDTCRPLLPAASGIGRALFLKKRLTMIMQGAAPKSLTSAGRIVTLSVGLVVLPIQPKFVNATREIKTIERIDDRSARVSRDDVGTSLVTSEEQVDQDFWIFQDSSMWISAASDERRYVIDVHRQRSLPHDARFLVLQLQTTIGAVVFGHEHGLSFMYILIQHRSHGGLSLWLVQTDTRLVYSENNYCQEKGKS